MPYVLPATPPPPPSLATPKHQSSRFLEVHPYSSTSSSPHAHAHAHTHGVHIQSKKPYASPSDIQSSNSAGAKLPGIPRRTPSSGPPTPSTSTSTSPPPSTYAQTPSTRRSRFILDESSSGSSSDSDAEEAFDGQDVPVLEENGARKGNNALLDARAERARRILAERLGGERSGVDERRDIDEAEKVAGCVFVSESESDCATPTMASASSPVPAASLPSTSTSAIPESGASSSSTPPNAPPNPNSTNANANANANSSIPGIAPRAPRGRGRARARGAAVFDLNGHAVGVGAEEESVSSDEVEVDAGLPLDSGDTLMKISGAVIEDGDMGNEDAARPVSGAGANVPPSSSGARSTTPRPRPPSIRIHVQGPLTPPSLVPFPTSIGGGEMESSAPLNPFSTSSSPALASLSSNNTAPSSNNTAPSPKSHEEQEQDQEEVAMGETITMSPPPPPAVPVPGIKRTNAQSLKLDLDALGNYARPAAPIPSVRPALVPSSSSSVPSSTTSNSTSSASSSTIHTAAAATSSITRSTTTSLTTDTDTTTAPLIRKKSGEVLKSSLKRRSQSHCSSGRPGLPLPFLVTGCTPTDDGVQGSLGGTGGGGGGGVIPAGGGRRGSVGCGAVVDPSPSLSSSSTPSTSTSTSTSTVLSVGLGLGDRQQQQQSSLSKSLPATPTSSKFVHFDAQLEHVKLFLAEQKPLAVSRDGSPTDETGTEGETGSASEGGGGYPWRGAGGGKNGKGRGYGSEEEEVQRRALVMRVLNLPAGRRPSSTNTSSHTTSNGGVDVLLETLELAADGLSVHGTVRVRNLAFEKRVAVRFTLDGWQTTSEVGAKWAEACRWDGTALSPSSGGGGSGNGNGNGNGSGSGSGEQFDRFEFSIRVGDMLLGKLQDKTLVLAVRYVCAGREMWDSNGGENYRAVFERRTPVVVEASTAVSGTSASTSATTTTIGRGLGELERKLEKVFLKAGDGESPGPTPLTASSSLHSSSMSMSMSMLPNKTATAATAAGAQRDSHSHGRLSPSSSSNANANANAGIPVSSSASHGHGMGTGGTKAETLSARYDFAASLKKPWKPRDDAHMRMNTFPASFGGHGHAHSSVPWPKKQYSHPQSQSSPSHPLSPEWRKNARAAFSPPPSSKRYAPGSPRDGHNSDNENGSGAGGHGGPVHHRHEHGHGRRHQRSYFDTWVADHGIASSNGYRDAYAYRDAHVRRTPPGTPERASAALALQNSHQQQHQQQRSLSDAEVSTVGSSRTATPNNESVPLGSHSHSPSPVHSPGPGRYHSFPPLLSPSSNPTHSSTTESSSMTTGMMTAPQISLRTSTDSTTSTLSTSSTSSVSTSSTSSSTNTSLVSSPALVSPLDFESLMTLSSSSPASGLPHAGGFKFGAEGVAEGDGSGGNGAGMRSPVDENGYKFFLNKFCFYTGRDASFLDIPPSPHHSHSHSHPHSQRDSHNQHQHQHQHADMMRRSYSASSVEELMSPSPFPPSSPSPGPSSARMSSHPSSEAHSPFPESPSRPGSGSGTPTRASSFDSISGSVASFSGVVTPRQRFGSFGYSEESPRVGGEREREWEVTPVRG
ncbi:hypothetical protein BD410DRAFT_834419 [Rickenella mellea]|uniref:CBM21 domain-containing protein n=1 Tax=Rickenella mellea TaxID=50990 RepID=A0A4Y7QKW3_9AGAM|nr:hypothetical protein BD410DRAFT_834419 [Rickenella mellea]